MGAPDGPVVHGLFAVAHPPEMGVEVGLENAAVQLVPDSGDDCRTDGIRQGKLGRIPDIAVVRGELPAALFAEGIDAV